MSDVYSVNEWGRLREVILGVPPRSPSLVWLGPDSPSALEIGNAARLVDQAYPSSIRDEIAEDFADFAASLRRAGVNVLRPEFFRGVFRHLEGWGVWEVPTAYNVRDLHLIVGNMVIETPSALRSRYFEASNLRYIWLKKDCKWISAPKPLLNGSKKEILFEAANTIRCGGDLVYLLASGRNNQLGATWLQRILGNEFKVHVTDFCDLTHIDTSIIALRPGLVLLNQEHIDSSNCPKFFKSWKKIYFDKLEKPSKEERELQRVKNQVGKQLRALGFKIEMPWQMTSRGVGMNLLSLDEYSAFVNFNQAALMCCLDNHGIDPIPVRWRHPYTQGGGLHCVTLDTVRDE